MKFSTNLLKKYSFIINCWEKKFISLNYKKINDSNKKFTCDKNKKTIIFIINNDYYFLLLYKNLIQEKNLLKNYNIVGLWYATVYPNKFNEILLYYFKQLLSFFFDLLIYNKYKKLYASIGFSKFYHFNISFFFSFLFKKFYYFNKDHLFKNLDELLLLKFKGLKIGDLVHDTFIRYTSNPTVYLEHLTLKKILHKSKKIVAFLEKIDSVLKFDTLISPYSSYLSFGIPIRYSLKKNKNVYTCGSMFSYYRKLSKKRPLHSENSLMFNSNQNKIKNETLLKKAKSEMKEKFYGKKVISSQYLNINTYHKKYKKYSDSRLDNLDGVVFLHDYFDAAHDQENQIFQNFFEWSKFTLDFISNEKLRIGIKPHPNSIMESKKVEDFFKKKYSNLIWLDPRLSNLNIFKKKNIKFGVSVNGSVLYELPYFRKFGISCGTNPTSAFKFNLNPKNINEYKYFLKNAQRMKFKNTYSKEVFKMYYEYCIRNKDNINLVCRNVNLISFKTKINFNGKALVELNNILDEKIFKLNECK
jgi:hypothetical protein